MKKRNILPVVLGLALIVGACSSDPDAETTTTDGATETTIAEETTTTGAASTGGIQTTDTDLGTILVDGNGFVLYVFTVDTDGESTCYEGCADVWPPVPGDSEISGDLDASIFGTVARTDGGDQLTVNGQPLYRYTPDANPGDTLGQGVNGVWFVVDASGSMVGGPEASNGSGTTDDGRDY